MKEHSINFSLRIYSLIVIGSLITSGAFGQSKLPELVSKQYHKLYGTPAPPQLNKTGLNFLLITDDQHHWMCMGYNDPDIKTPNLDQLASKGVIFDRAYSTNPTCTPTRAESGCLACMVPESNRDN